MDSPGTSADPKGDRSGSRISLQTLIVASAASAAASFLASRIWGAGTLVSAAVTPIVVAIVSEFLRRPVRTVAETARKVPTIYTLPAHERTTPAPQETTPAQQADPAVSETGQPVRAAPPTTRRSAVWRRRWLLAVATGLAAFVIVVIVFTVPDLVAGRSITGNGQPTTFFGGSAKATKARSSTSATSTVTTTTTTVSRSRSTTATSRTTTTATSSTPSSSTGSSTTTPTTSTAPGVSSTPTSTAAAP